jgi:hypothetical protein
MRETLFMRALSDNLVGWDIVLAGDKASLGGYNSFKQVF